MKKVVWITGVSRGLGNVLARGLAETGWTVAGCARSQDRLDSLQSDLGDEHFFQSANVADERSMQGWVAAASAATRTPDLLINNAAIINDPKPLWQMTSTEIDDILSINIAGTIRMIRLVTALMIERGEGIIANLSSGWGRSTSPEVAPYCATKWAIEGLTQSLASELPAGLAAVAVNPGVIDTAMLRQTWQDGAEGFPKASEWGRLAVPFFSRLKPSQNGASLTVS